MGRLVHHHEFACWDQSDFYLEVEDELGVSFSHLPGSFTVGELVDWTLADLAWRCGVGREPAAMLERLRYEFSLRGADTDTLQLDATLEEALPIRRRRELYYQLVRITGAVLPPLRRRFWSRVCHWVWLGPLVAVGVLAMGVWLMISWRLNLVGTVIAIPVVMVLAMLAWLAASEHIDRGRVVLPEPDLTIGDVIASAVPEQIPTDEVERRVIDIVAQAYPRRKGEPAWTRSCDISIGPADEGQPPVLPA